MLFDRVLQRDETPVVLSYVRSLLTAERFHGRALVQVGGSVTQWHLEVDRPARTWFAVSEEGQTREFTNSTLFDDGVAMPGDWRNHGPTHGPAVFAFPEFLHCWGQPRSAPWPMLMQRIGRKSVLVTFEHGADPSLRTTLVIDTELGLMTRSMGIAEEYRVLVDIELGRGIERLRPESYPELEVLEPDF